MTTSPSVSVNGIRVDGTMPAIAPFDRGVTLGDGIFETMKYSAGEVWYIDRHLARLAHAASRMGITYPPLLREWIGAILPRDDTDATPRALRVTLTRGITLAPGLSGTEPAETTTIIALSAPLAISTAGITAAIAEAPRNERAFTAGLKTTSYAESIVALRDANAAGFNDVLWLDSRGYTSELSASNIFVVQGTTLATPSRGCGILPGITRAVTIELAKELGITVREEELSLGELQSADELFCTNSLRTIVPVIQLGDQVIGTGHQGPITERLARYYATRPTRQ